MGGVVERQESEVAVAVEIRRDIYEKHKSLFGDKTVNGVVVPARLLERSKRARERLAAA